MKTVSLNIAMMGQANVQLCPYCGGEPCVTVELQNKTFESDKVTHQMVTCPYCGLSAAINIWEAICAQIKNPIFEDAETE